MARMMENKQAPDFELTDTRGQTVRLSDYRDQCWVLLVLNRGFA